MDKYEYKIRSEEIKSLIAKGEYGEAVAIADTIDWRRVKSVMMLCTISDLYKINRRLEDARDMLLLAYDRHPGGRSIVYSLCELAIKMDDFVQAVEYYKEFVQVAPRDSGRFVLQYKLYEAQDVSLEERIAVLEELKAKDYIEKWAYELAYLYHRIGLSTRCVEECDDLILWFGEGKYVLKAMELKKLHEPLTPEQQAKYDDIKGVRMQMAAPAPAEEPKQQAYEQPQYGEDLTDAPTREIPQEELEIQVKLMGVGQYDTMNMQKELAQNMKELWEGPTPEEMNYQTEVAAESVPENTAPFNADTEMIDLPDDEPEEEPLAPVETKVEEVFFGETAEIDTTATQVMEELKKETLGGEEKQPEEELTSTPAGDMTEWHVSGEYAKVLGMEYDGQISMLMPETEQLEKQITGQISLEDVLLEWEKMKKDSEQKRMEAVRQRVQEQTDSIFSEFDAATKDGLLEKLENTRDVSVSEEEIAEADETEEVEEIEEIQESEFEEEIPDEDDVQMEMEFDEMPEDEDIPEEEISEEEAPEEEIPQEETEEVTEETEESEEESESDEEEEFSEEEITEELEVSSTEEEVEEPEEAETETEEETTEEAAEESETESDAETEEPEDEVVEESEDKAEEEPAEESEEEDSTEEVSEEETGEKPKKRKPAREARGRVRALSPEEQKLFATYIQNKVTREQITYAIDNISMASYAGNVVITGEEGMDTFTLAKNLIKEVQRTDSNFSGKIAKISGASLNRKGVDSIIENLKNGALIIQSAGQLETNIVNQLHKALNQEQFGMIVVLEDNRKEMHRLFKENHILEDLFKIEINVEALDNDALVAYGRKYAREQEYGIDELGVLALHTSIAEKQTSDHTVTVAEVKEIVDQAIRHANKKTPKHFFDILLAKRYDDEDMIVLREKDFI